MPDPDQRRAADTAEPSDDVVRDAVHEDSDALLRAVDELRRLETAKRDVPMSTPNFHDKASQIEDLARGVFGLARRETADGERLGETQAMSINDEAREDEDREDEAADDEESQ